MSSKRSISKHRREGAKKAKQEISIHNPFLNFQASSSEVGADDDVLSHTIAFLGIKSKKQAKTKEKPGKGLLESLDYLLRFLERNQSIENVEFKSAASVESTAAMLLPWVTGELLAASSSGPPDALLWRALAASLKALTAPSSDTNNSRQNVILQTLTTKSLLILIPQASHTGLRDDKSGGYAAVCYELLLRSGHFVPSIDVVFQSFLSVIVKDIADPGHTKLHSCRIIRTTLLVLEDTLKKANPKTSFQVLSTEVSLLKWSSIYFYLQNLQDEDSSACQELMLKILWGSFFHSDHHLDGFRSLLQLRGVPSLEREIFDTTTHESIEKGSEDAECPSSSSRFQCYQENLLISLEKLLLAPSSLAATSLRISLLQSLVLIAKLLPLLLQGFLQELVEFEGKNKSTTSKKKGSKFDLAQMQLFFFGTIASLLWQRRSLCCSDDQNRIGKHCLQSLSKCLTLLLEHDAFVPSDDEKQLTRFKFLESLMAGMLQTAEPDADVSEHTSSIVETLMRLDHRLVHDRLEEVITFILVPTNDGQVVPSFFLSLFETYHQLRQFHHVFDAILAVASSLQSHKMDQQLRTLHSMLSRSRAKQAFANAILDSPTEETKMMFEGLDKQIADSAKMGQRMSEMGYKSMEVAVEQVGAGLLQNVRVDRNTASDIAGYCETMMNSSAQALCHENEGSDVIGKTTKFGVKLCGWIISLQMRVSFWLGYQYIQKSEIEASMPQRVKQLLLSNETSTSASSNDFHLLINDLVVLASFRLRKLDYLIHEQSLKESEELSPRQQYEDEAKRLAELMSSWADDTRVEVWQQIAQVTTSWAPYADEDQLQSFLMWMFSALALEQSANSRERAVARALMNDASFFEIGELSDRMAPCALDSITLLIREALEPAIALSIQEELCLTNQPTRKASSPEQFNGLFRRGSGISLGGKEVHEATLNSLRGALRVATILNEIPTLHSSACSVTCADSAVRIQSICSRLGSQNPDVIALVIDLVSTLRILATRYIAHAGTEALSLLPANRTKTNDLLVNVKDTLESMLKVDIDFGAGPGRKILCATEELIRAICSCYQHGASGTPLFGVLVDFSKTAFRAKKKKAKKVEAIVLCAVCRGVLSALCFADATRYEPLALEELLLTFINWITGLTKSDSTESSALLYGHVRLLTGTLFRWASLAFADGIPSHVTDQMAELIGHLVPSKPVDEGSRSGLEATSYMVLGYATTNPTSEQRMSLVDKLLCTECESQMLNASICHLVRGMEGKSLSETLSKVNQRILDESTIGLRLFQLLVRGLKAEGQVEIVSTFVEGILGKTVDLLDISNDAAKPAKNVVIAASLIAELIQDKRLMTMKERHVALILAQVSQVLQHADRNEEVYSSCFALVAALVQRFPKQMCTCVPSLIAVLHAFQRQVLYGEADDVTVRERSQKFTRLCELLLPHKDVYKKHVLCLLLEFVHCLEHGLNLLRKECLLPSVFYLLDMLSKYEMQQLNTLMDTTAKALFRSVHQSYNKLHAYRGQ